MKLRIWLPKYNKNDFLLRNNTFVDEIKNTRKFLKEAKNR